MTFYCNLFLYVSVIFVVLITVMNPFVPLLAVYVTDEKGGYTGYFVQFPEIIAEGDTREETEKNLFDLMYAVFQHQQKAIIDVDGMNYSTQEYKLQVS